MSWKQSALEQCNKLCLSHNHCLFDHTLAFFEIKPDTRWRLYWLILCIQGNWENGAPVLGEAVFEADSYVQLPVFFVPEYPLQPFFLSQIGVLTHVYCCK